MDINDEIKINKISQSNFVNLSNDKKNNKSKYKKIDKPSNFKEYFDKAIEDTKEST